MIRALPPRILAAGLALAALLIGLVVFENNARAGGREVLLPMEAVDPRDLLTGHYVALQLTQVLPVGQPCPQKTSAYREGGWLGLRAAAGHHRFVTAAASRSAAMSGGADVAVRGGVYCARMAFGDGTGDAVTLDLGVRRFHADQDEALAIEQALSARRPGEPPSAFAVVSVGQDGRARLKGVVVGDKRTNLTWF